MGVRSPAGLRCSGCKRRSLAVATGRDSVARVARPLPQRVIRARGPDRSGIGWPCRAPPSARLPQAGSTASGASLPPDSQTARNSGSPVSSQAGSSVQSSGRASVMAMTPSAVWMQTGRAAAGCGRSKNRAPVSQARSMSSSLPSRFRMFAEPDSFARCCSVLSMLASQGHRRASSGRRASACCAVRTAA